MKRNEWRECLCPHNAALAVAHPCQVAAHIHTHGLTRVHTHQRVSTLWPGRGHCSCPGSLAGSSLIPVGHHVGRTRVSVTPSFPSPASLFVSPQNVASVFRLPGPVVPVVSTGGLTALGPKMQMAGEGRLRAGVGWVTFVSTRPPSRRVGPG